MSLFQILYSLLILPLETIFEWIFNLISQIPSQNNIIFGIIGLSLVINLLTLPLYNIAEKAQNIQKQKEKQLAPGVARIKHAFKGDEQMMILSTFYKQNHYSPLSSFKSSLTVLIELPFFIAAYHLLSNMPELNGESFLFIKDLSKPDNLFYINLLPFVMTIINLISGIIYCHNSTLKEKIQVFGIAIIFLFLLYNSPSGLLIYWILNNIFSLCKNIIQKKSKSVIKNTEQRNLQTSNIFKSVYFQILLISGFSLAFFYGILIPSQIIKSSPMEFAFIGNTDSPTAFILSSFLMFSGMFVIWPLIIFSLSPKKAQIIEATIFSLLLFSSVLNLYLFKVNYSTISNSFIISDPKILTQRFIPYLIGSIIFISVFITLFIIANKKNKLHFINYAASILLLTIFSISFLNTNHIIKSMKIVFTKNTISELGSADIPFNKIYNFSKTKKNVVVIFLDRAISSFFPKIISQQPELKNSFSGFTYYPNTLSFGDHTVIAAPAMSGGYEYTPERINSRKDDLLKDKHNEALMVMPVLFSQAGFDVTVSNQPFSNYKDHSSKSIYSDYSQIKSYNTYKLYTQKLFNELNIPDTSSPLYTEKNCYKQIRNFSILEGFFPPLRYLFYKINIAPSKNVSFAFWSQYADLHYLSNQTEFTSQNNNFIFIGNDTTHEPFSITKEYKIQEEETSSIQDHFYVNQLTIEELAVFLDYLKENNVYDNSRIIIVSDHGASLELDGANNFEDPSLPFTFNPLLLVKDFDSTGEPKTDSQFMTNADTLFLAKQNLDVSNINPFTNQELVQQKDLPLYVHKVLVQECSPNRIMKRHMFTFKNEYTWIINGNLFDGNNWKTDSETDYSYTKEKVSIF